MRNLLPHLIQERFTQRTFSGMLDAVTLFVDISGFTSMTQALMRHGKEGAEVLSDILNRVFAPIVHAVYDRDGFIVGFAGDACTAIFPRHDADTALVACAAAEAIREILVAQGRQQTRLGDFELTAQLGLSAGPVEWGIIGPVGHRAYFFRGPAIDGCAQAEHQAQGEDVVLDARVRALLPAGAVDLLPGDITEFVRLRQLRRTPPEGHTPPGVDRQQPDRQVIAQFFPATLLDIAQAGEFRDVASVFISFRGTPTLESLEALVGRVIDVADQFGGYFNGLIFGDKGGTALVHFGAPVAHENDRERALDFVLSLQAETSGNSCPAWRAGIAFGPMYAGFVGAPLRCDYTTLGDTVNLSARLMMDADWGQILVAALVARLRAFQFAHVGDRSYKGFARPVPTFRLLGTRPVERFFAHPLVGRGAELRRLVEFAAPIFAGQLAGAAIVYGEPGVGKSHLLYEVRQQLRGPRSVSSEALISTPDQVSWFIGQTDQVLRQAFGPFVYWLKRYFNQSPEATLYKNRVRFEQHLNRLLDDLAQLADPHPTADIQYLRAELTRTRSVLGALVGLRWPDSLYERLDAKGRHENTLFAVKTLLLAESCLRPTVLELEDGHWLDEASQGLLTVLTRNLAGYPLLVLITSRYADDGTKPDFALAPDMPTLALDLGLLSAVDLRQQAEATLDGAIDDALQALLEAKSQGNPFFVQQVLYYFRENGLLTRDTDGVWHVQATTSELPTRINAILIARIDRLTQQVKRVVQTAAVLGREFEVRILAQMLRCDVLPEVQQAEQEQVWVALRELRYLFKHALLRDAAYEMQLRARLRELHRLAAGAYTQLYGTGSSSGLSAGLGELYATLAYHYGQGGDESQERHYARLAGERAAAQFEHAEAVHWLGRALELTPERDRATRYELVRLREDVYALQGNSAAQQADLSSLLELASGLGAAEQSEAALRQARYDSTVTGDYPAAIAAVQTAIARATEAGDKAQVAAGHRQWGEILRLQGAYPAAQAQYEQARVTAVAAGATPVIAHSLRGLGIVAWHLGEYAEAREYLSQSLAIYQETGDRSGEGATLNNLGIVAGDLGQYARAQGYLEQSLAIRQEMGDRWRVAMSFNNLGMVAERLGAYAQARGYYEQSLVTFQELGSRQAVGHVLNNLGVVAHDLGEYARAQGYHEQSLVIRREIGERRGEAESLHNLGKVAWGLGEYSRARVFYQEALDIRRGLNQPHHVVEDLAGLAQVALVQGDLARAREVLTEILTHLEDDPAVAGAERPFRVHLICYRVLRASNDARASVVLERAHGLLQKQAARIQDPDSRRSFLRNVPDHRDILTAWAEIQESG